MLNNSHETPQPTSRINDVVIGVLSTTVLVLAGIVSIAPFVTF
ncbi:MAG TPA: hypothetical protein VGF97_16740 [Rhizomicrobium sp.]